MVTADLNKIELTEFTAPENPGQRCKAAFPLLGFMGSKKSAAVYVELDPGEELGSHTDSVEETLIVLEGRIEAKVGEETTVASKGGLVLVPEMIEHNFRNIGKEKAKVLGFFGGANNIVATFENTWLPTNSNMVDTTVIED